MLLRVYSPFQKLYNHNHHSLPPADQYPPYPHSPPLARPSPHYPCPIKSLIYPSRGEIWIRSLLKNKKRLRKCHRLFHVSDVKERVFLSPSFRKEKMIYQNSEKIYLSFQKIIKQYSNTQIRCNWSISSERPFFYFDFWNTNFCMTILSLYFDIPYRLLKFYLLLNMLFTHPKRQQDTCRLEK